MLRFLFEVLDEVSHTQLADCYRRVSVLKEQLQELRSRFRFSNSTLVVHNTQSHMQQVGLTAQLCSEDQRSHMCTAQHPLVSVRTRSQPVLDVSFVVDGERRVHVPEVAPVSRYGQSGGAGVSHGESEAPCSEGERLVFITARTHNLLTVNSL